MELNMQVSKDTDSTSTHIHDFLVPIIYTTGRLHLTDTAVDSAHALVGCASGKGRLTVPALLASVMYVREVACSPPHGQHDAE
eukprot:3354651-Amphidinium_carterae.1